MPISSSALPLTAYPGDGAVLLGFSLDPTELKTHDLVGFSIQCTPPAGKPFFLENRLNFANPVTSSTTATQTPWTSSENAPFQKFHWVHFPANVLQGTFHYEVTARYCQGSNMADGPKATVAVELAPQAGGNFELGLTGPTSARRPTRQNSATSPSVLCPRASTTTHSRFSHSMSG
jgi:hypothetical protein